MTIFAATVSLLLGVPLRPDVATVGEITLRGRILPVEGVKAKVLAAHRAGVREIVLPARNERDLEDVPEEVKQEVLVGLVHKVDEVLPLVMSPAAEGSAVGSSPPRSAGAHL